MESDKNYFRLGQLYMLLNNGSRNIFDFKTFIHNSDLDINYAIPSGSSVINHMPQYSGYTALHFAVKFQDEDATRELLLAGAKITNKANNGFTPLRLAVEYYKNLQQDKLIDQPSNISMIRVLLNNNKSNNGLNPSCRDGISHFHIACLANNMKEVYRFLKIGVPVNQAVSSRSVLFPGFTPLHFATRYGDRNLVQLLLDEGADVSYVDGNGMTPLRLLIDRNIEINDCVSLGKKIYKPEDIQTKLNQNDLIINVLIRKIITDNLKIVDDVGLSVLHISCVTLDASLVEEYLQLDMDVNLAVNYNSPIWPGYTPLHFAAHCNIQTVMLLLKKGADIVATDVKNITPFDLCVQRYKPSVISDILRCCPMLSCIALVNGKTLIEEIDAFESINSFSNYNYNINACIPLHSILWPGYTIAHLAVTLSKMNYDFYHYYLVKNNHFLNKHFKYNSDVDDFIHTCFCNKSNMMVQAANGMTPLHLAFRTQKKKILQCILNQFELSVDNIQNCMDYEGLSHLQIACIVNNYKIVKSILRQGLESNLPLPCDLIWYSSKNESELKLYKAGSTLYQIAAINDSEDMIKVLLDAGINDVLDTDEFTAVHTGFYNSCKTNTLKVLLSIPGYLDQNYTTLISHLSHLHVACYANDIEAVRKLLTVTSNIEEPIRTETIDLYAELLAPYVGYTPLHLAVYSESYEIIDLLISKGVDIRTKITNLNALHLSVLYCKDVQIIKKLYREIIHKSEWCDNFNLTKLHFACFIDDIDEVKKLLSSEKNINTQVLLDSPIWPGNTALHILASFSDLDKVKLLLSHGADVNVKNADNDTPLHTSWKIEVREPESMIISNLIISHAGPQFFNSNPCDDEGVSHFHISCTLGNLDVVKHFIKSGININEQVCGFASMYEGFTPLHMATHFKQKEVIELLLDNGANCELEDSMGYTPIQTALKGSLNIFESFFRHAKVDIQSLNVFGESVFELIFQWKSENTPYFQILIDKGVCIYFMNPSIKKSIIAQAAWKLDQNIFRKFIEKATDVLSIDESMKNVIHNILSYRVTFHNHDDKCSAIHQCVLNLNSLIAKGCDLEHRDQEGRTPLHDATETGQMLVKVLLLLGANINACDNNNCTPVMYSGNSNMQELFLDYLYRMDVAGLYINETNQNFLKRYWTIEGIKKRNKYQGDLKKMKNIRVADEFTLRDLLTEQIIGRFPKICTYKRKAILEFLGPEKVQCNYQNWEEWTYLLQWQYRRLLNRCKLIDPATGSFINRVYKLPALCIDSIVKHLSNDDLENIIKL